MTLLSRLIFLTSTPSFFHVTIGVGLALIWEHFKTATFSFGSIVFLADSVSISKSGGSVCLSLCLCSLAQKNFRLDAYWKFSWWVRASNKLNSYYFIIQYTITICFSRRCIINKLTFDNDMQDRSEYGVSFL